MLTIPLARLEREGALDIQAAIPPDDPIWEGTELRFSTPLIVSGQAQLLSTGGYLVKVALRGALAQECRRCLDPVETPMNEELSLLFLTPGETPEEGEDEVREVPREETELVLDRVIREELLLIHWPYAVCREDCRGLCPRCGINLNEDSCQCSDEELDPRWDALRALNEERE